MMMYHSPAVADVMMKSELENNQVKTFSDNLKNTFM